MKKIIIALIMCSLTYAKYIDGEAKFLAHDGDSVSFIKKQLLSNSFKKVIDQELKIMGLDSVTFWNNYNLKFEEHFQAIKETVDSRYKKAEEEEIPASKKEAYEKEVRYKRLHAKAKFGRLSRAIQSYSIKKLSKSVRLPNSHYINVSAKVDRKALTDIYYNFIGVSQYRNLRKLYVEVDYNLKNTNWIEVGVQTEGDFVNVVNEHWKQKLEASVKDVFSDGVEIVNEDSRSLIQKRLKSPTNILRTSDSSLIEGDESGINESLYLKITINIEKQDSEQELKKIALNFSGGLILTDLKDNTIVSYQDFPDEAANFEIIDQNTLSTNIASLVYRLPMNTIQRMRKTVEENAKIRSSFDIVLKGTQNINEAFRFIKLLKEKGVLYYFDPVVSSMVDEEVKITVSYIGVREKALIVLGNMISLEVAKNRYIKKDGVLPFVFNIEGTQENKMEKVNQNSAKNNGAQG